jgi:glycerol transport system ATP-binding protein
MQLALEDIEVRVGAKQHLYPLSMALKSGAVSVLLGATQAGKTTLMRIMAGLDKPTRGKLLLDNQDITGTPVRGRNVAMVYQQFINYPSMTVFDNIASPLRLAKHTHQDVQSRVQAIAKKLHIEPFLQRLPAQLSGGQQQRVALARALAKNAPLMLLDEPLVNLDYKLREELRDELTQLFAATDATVVYATTEPGEALLLGGYTAVLDKGQLLQYGPTAQVFHQPASIQVARAFSDPPMNLIQAQASAHALRLPGELEAALQLPAQAAGQTLTVGIRASALRQHAQPGDIEFKGRVELAEISGSDTFVHVATQAGELVAQFAGVHVFALNQTISLFVHTAQFFVFDVSGKLMVAPTRELGLEV